MKRLYAQHVVEDDARRRVVRAVEERRHGAGKRLRECDAFKGEVEIVRPRRGEERGLGVVERRRERRLALQDRCLGAGAAPLAHCLRAEARLGDRVARRRRRLARRLANAHELLSDAVPDRLTDFPRKFLELSEVARRITDRDLPPQLAAVRRERDHLSVAPALRHRSALALPVRQQHLPPLVETLQPTSVDRTDALVELPKRLRFLHLLGALFPALCRGDPRAARRLRPARRLELRRGGVERRQEAAAR